MLGQNREAQYQKDTAGTPSYHGLLSGPQAGLISTDVAHTAGVDELVVLQARRQTAAAKTLNHHGTGMHHSGGGIRLRRCIGLDREVHTGHISMHNREKRQDLHENEV